MFEQCDRHFSTPGPGGNPQTHLLVRANRASGGGSGSIHLSGRGAGTTDPASRIDIRDGAQVITTANRDSSAGNLGFTAETFVLDEGAEVFSIVSENAVGGVIDVAAGEATIANGSFISSEAAGTQTGARIVITSGSLLGLALLRTCLRRSRK